ncbi:DUF1566 domain-containing protein [Thermodesulfobacteriota bacterium]
MICLFKNDKAKRHHFQDTLSYWSSTTFGPNKNNAWIVMFDGAYVLSYYKTNKYHIRCVRG